MASLLNVHRGTTYGITHTYMKNGVVSTDGATLFFTVKQNESDLDDTDATHLGGLSKNIAMTTGITSIVLNPADTQDITPGKYWYDIKILETGGAIYRGDKGRFVLDASPTNRLSP